MSNKEIKICLTGTGGVGKSAITLRLINGIFVEIYDPTCEDSYRKQISVDDKDCLIEVLGILIFIF